jgi:hypothetical protein
MQITNHHNACIIIHPSHPPCFDTLRLKLWMFVTWGTKDELGHLLIGGLIESGGPTISEQCAWWWWPDIPTTTSWNLINRRGDRVGLLLLLLLFCLLLTYSLLVVQYHQWVSQSKASAVVVVEAKAEAKAFCVSEGKHFSRSRRTCWQGQANYFISKNLTALTLLTRILPRLVRHRREGSNGLQPALSMTLYDMWWMIMMVMIKDHDSWDSSV